MTVEVIKDKIIPILQRYDVKRAAIFGSMKVDLVEYSTIKPLIKEKILSEQVVIL